MQPYFFPYLGYFNLIKHSDQFIVFDTSQYKRHGWINRNKILHPKGGSTYIAVAIEKTSLKNRINEIKIKEAVDWERKILSQLVQYKRKAPHYYKVLHFLEECFSSKTENLSDFNVNLLRKTCDYLEISHHITVLSHMDLRLDTVKSPDEWALNISKSMNADIYINAPGGIEFFDRKKYEGANIELQFIKSNLPSYFQGDEKFVPGLSIIDVMMFNTIEEIQQMLDDYEIIK